MRKVIGTVATLFVVALLGLWWADSRGLIPGYAQLRAYTDDASGLTDGTRVRVNGIPIGYLDHQRLTGSQNPKRRVEFDMKVKSSFLSKIPVDSVVGIVADNLLSDKSIDITPGTSPQHVQSGAELRSVQAVDPNGLMAQAGNDLQALQNALKHLDTIISSVDAGQGSAGKLKKDWESNLSKMPGEFQKLTTEYGQARGSLYLLLNDDELSKQVRVTQARFDDILGAFQAGQGTAGKLSGLDRELEGTMQQIQQLKTAIAARTGNLDDLQKHLDALMAKFNGILDKINAGQGTLGQLQVNPQLSEALAGVGREFQGLAKDMRANPKKFFTFRLAVF